MFPHAPSGIDPEQVIGFESQFGDFLVVPRCYYAVLIAAFHVEGLQPRC